MSSNVFSSLSRGYGTWTGSFGNVIADNDSLPRIDPDVWCHRHGVTVKSRASSAPAKVSVADGGHMGIPKTFLTRKGALMLFSAPESMPQEPENLRRLHKKRHQLKDILNCSLKLKTLERLSLSVLQYGCKDSDKKTESIYDNEFVLNCLCGVDRERCKPIYDKHSLPGRDVQFYLQDLRNLHIRRHGASLYRARSAELQDILQQLKQTVRHYTVLHSKESILTDSVASDTETSSSPIISFRNTRSLSRNDTQTSYKSTDSVKSSFYIDQMSSLGTDWSEKHVEVEESYASVNSARDQDDMLIELPCDLIEEKNSDSFSDDQSDDREDSNWSTERNLKVSFRNRIVDSSACKGRESENINVGIIQPLHPPYSVKMEDFGWTPANELMAHDLKSDQGIGLPGEQTLSRRGATASSPMLRAITPGHLAEHSKLEVSLMSDDDEDLSVSSEDRTIIEIDNVISLHRDEEVITPTRINETGQDTFMQTLENTALTVPKKATSDKISESKPDSIIAEKRKQESTLIDQNKTVVLKDINVNLPILKAKTHDQEIKKPVEDMKIGGNSESKADNIKSQLSNRMLIVKEEKVENLTKEKQKTLTMKDDESKRSHMDDKRKAAEERLKMLTDEVARKKEEQKKMQEEGVSSGIISEKTVKLTTSSGRTTSSLPGKGKSKGNKLANKKVKLSLTSTGKLADETDKDTTDHESMQPVRKSKDLTVSFKSRVKIQPVKRQVLIPKHIKEMLSRKTNSQTRDAIEAEIGKMMSAMDKDLRDSGLQTDENEGLSAEDFALAQKTLMERIKTAEEHIQEGSPRKESQKVSPQKVKLDKQTMKKNKKMDAEKKQKLAKEREAIREQQMIEKQRKLEEVMRLQEKISLKEEARKENEANTKRKAEELLERIETLRREEEQIAKAEADARAQVAAERRRLREDREARRKLELENRKQAAIEKREKEKAMIEAARQQEVEMLLSIVDAEMAKRLKEEEEAKRDEEELAAEDRFEAEMREAEKAAEEDEERLRDLEKQAEEEAFQSLVEEKEAAEKQRWKLEEQTRFIKEEEERMKQELLKEENRLKEEIRKREEEEERQREVQRARLRELQKIEEEARQRMQAVLEQRRAEVLHRREYNLNVRSYMDAIKQSQGFTDPWTFTYFVPWPKETYMRLMGQDPKKQTGAMRPKMKSAPDPSARAEAKIPSSVGVTALES